MDRYLKTRGSPPHQTISALKLQCCNTAAADVPTFVLKNVEDFSVRNSRRIVVEETGSMAAMQNALDHANLSTTTVYVQRIAVKRDLHSAAVARRRNGRDEV